MIPVFFFSHFYPQSVSKRATRENFRTAGGKHSPGRKRQKKIAIVNEVIDIALTTSLPPMIVVDFSFA